MTTPSVNPERNFALPWGYWLIEGIGGPGVTDEAGQHWRSVRHCLWQTRLGLPFVPPGSMDMMLDYLLMLLALIDRYAVGPEESLRDIRHGGSLDAEFMKLWMQTQSLYVENAYPHIRDELTPEGRSIMLMLFATHEPESTPPPVGIAWINPRQSPFHGLDRAPLEELILEHEAFAKSFEARFERRTVANMPTIILIRRRSNLRMPLQEVVWSLGFDETFARDRFYLWLLSRIDRWQRWGEIVYRQGPRAFSDYLTTLAFCDVLPITDVGASS